MSRQRPRVVTSAHRAPIAGAELPVAREADDVEVSALRPVDTLLAGQCVESRADVPQLRGRLEVEELNNAAVTFNENVPEIEIAVDHLCVVRF